MYSHLRPISRPSAPPTLTSRKTRLLSTLWAFWTSRFLTNTFSSDRYAVTGLEQGPDGVLTMTARCTPAELGTADLAEWFLLAQVPRDALDSVPENFQLVLE